MVDPSPNKQQEHLMKDGDTGKEYYTTDCADCGFKHVDCDRKPCPQVESHEPSKSAKNTGDILEII